MERNTKGENRRQAFWIGITLLIIATISFVYWANQKQIWFCDEVYTYESANGFEQEWPAFYTDEWMMGADVEAFFAADAESLSLNDISIRLYNDHVPLYFWIFRIVSFLFFKGSGSIWIGLSINLFFYWFVLVLGYRLFLHLTNNSILSGVVMVLTSVANRLMLEQATTLRMYMMLLWAEILLVLVGLWILRQIPKDKMSFGAFGCLFVVSVIGLLTHYHFWVFYAITAALFCLWLLFVAVKKQKKRFWKAREFHYVLAWVCNFVIALLVTVMLFPYCRWNLNRGKGEMALQSVFDFSADKLKDIVWGYQRLSATMFGETLPTVLGLVVMFGCILGGIYVLYRRNEFRKLIGLVLIVLIAQAYQLVVCFTLPDGQEERYLWGSFTLMMFCMVWGGILLWQALFAQISSEKVRNISQKIVFAVLTIGILAAEVMIIDGGNGIAYLFQQEKDVDALEQHKDIPWIVYGPTVGVYSYYDWLIPDEICFLTVDNMPADAEAVRELKDDESFIMYAYEDYAPWAVAFFEQELGKTLTCNYLTKSTNLTVYLIEEVE